MTIMRSLRSRLTLASILWTGGLLMLMHMLSIAFMHSFPGTHTVGISFPVFIGVLLMLAGLSGLRSGLTPFRELRTRLVAVREGNDRRVTGQYPSEVQPLVDDLNALLEDREKAVKRALATAGDLAHGLKTPLAVLAQEAERLGCGNEALAESIGQQVERMRRQVDYHLARARAAASGASPGARCLVGESSAGLVRTLSKLYADRALQIEVDAGAEIAVRVQREDLDEMLGNLLDNACKWAKSRIAVHAEMQSGLVSIAVEDDGPGLPAPLRTVVLQRGMRADEAAPGSGLGLGIVRDLAELYGGTISLGESPMGGVRAELRLPGC
jgi:signal transduction histidine kinase